MRSVVSGPLLVSAREAARLLSVSDRTLWTLSHNGRLPRVTIGRAVRYSVDDLQAFIAASKEGGHNGR